MANKWIQKSLGSYKKGSLRKTLGVSKKTGNIPFKKIKTAAKSLGVTGKRARLAMTLKKMHPK